MMIMKYQGIGVMIHNLVGGSRKSAREYYGKRIISAVLDQDAKDDGAVLIGFEDYTKIAVYDAGRSCCEERYITTDDDLQSLVGHTLIKIEARDGPDIEDDDEAHETAFVQICTDVGFVTLVTHNKHNGYYSGFALSIDEIENDLTRWS